MKFFIFLFVLFFNFFSNPVIGQSISSKKSENKNINSEEETIKYLDSLKTIQDKQIKLISKEALKIYGDSIKSYGLNLSKKWKFKMEDKPDFALNDFDDSKWEIKNTDDLIESFNLKEDYQIGWFRKKVYLDSNMVEKIFEFLIETKGAAEIYIKGKKVVTVGQIKKNKKKSKLWINNDYIPYNIDFNDIGEQTIAIKFQFCKQGVLAKHLQKFPMEIKLLKSSTSIKSLLVSNTTGGFNGGMSAGFFFMMCILHYIFYSLFKSQKFNIYFSLAMFLFGVNFYLKTFNDFYSSMDAYAYIYTFSKVVFILGHIILLSAVYDFLHFEKKLIFTLMVITFLLATIGKYFHFFPKYVELIGYLLLICNYIYIIYKSASSNHEHGKVLRNAAIIFITFFVAVFCAFIIYAIVTQYNVDGSDATDINQSALLSVIILTVIIGPQLSISGSISYTLAKQYVKTNLDLAQKLKEVDMLSHEKQEILANQNEKLEKLIKERTNELKLSIEELTAAQAQLIQSEKMASLGELTAGIAHEIKNPLNFVNNFAELNEELIVEMHQELDASNLEHAKQLSDDIKSNLQKISFHGKRADSIVKSMLEHSRNSTGQKETIDLNALIREYFNLAYHGTKAKNKSFNCKLELNLDNSLSDISLVPQDIGRVILNITTNAFYAVDKGHEKNKNRIYDPVVSISTKEEADGVVIRIKDNGFGIPNEIKEKIFQPFFTTKPTGQGTGLGLSLVYDILKAHGGDLQLESKEGEFTEFIIELPCG